MANYYMYVDKLNDVKRWKQYLENKKTDKFSAIPKECHPLSFRKNNGEVSTSFMLAELDLLTAYQENEEQFLQNLLKHKAYQNILSPSSHPIIVHSSKKKLVDTEPIYNNKLLAVAAKYVINENSKGKNISEITLEEKGDIKDYVSRVKDYLKTPNIRSLLMADKVTNNPVLRKAMEEYIENYNKYRYSETEGNFFSEVERNLSYYLRKYDVLRQIVSFEKLHNLDMKEEKNTSSDNNTQMKFVLKDDKSKLEKVVNEHNIVIPKKALTEDDLLGSENNYGRDNDVLTYWYNIGGVPAILENIDIDELLNYSQEDLNSVGLGYIKGKNDDEVFPGKKI